MPAKKYHLTSGRDRMTGTSGNDLFIAEMLQSGSKSFKTLNNSDILNGGKGVDTVRADLVDGLVVPVMTNIEKGVFTLAESVPVTLDLARARQMTQLDLRAPNDIGENDGDTLFVKNAQNVEKIALRRQQSQDVHVDGIDPRDIAVLSVTFDRTHLATLHLDTATSATFKAMDVTLLDCVLSNIADDADTRSLSIHSRGTAGFNNQFWFNPSSPANGLQAVKIDGDRHLELVIEAGNLRSFDASAAAGGVYISGSIGGAKLTSVRGGAGDDMLMVDAIGGSKTHMATLALGAGNDDLYLMDGTGLTAGKHLIQGGAGEDTVHVHGNLARTAGLFKGVEALDFFDFKGHYDFAGAHFDTVTFSTPAASTVVDHFDTGMLLVFDSPAYWDKVTLTVNVSGAEGATEDHLRLQANGAGSVGSPNGGLFLPDLSHLTLTSLVNGGSVCLGTIGSAIDHAEITIAGDKRFWLSAANGSTSHIDRITITTAAGADISGLANTANAFVSTGATITGGAGNDVLVGGAGNDVISSGGGDNTVHLSGGNDVIHLEANSGLDTIAIDHVADASISGRDEITNFGALDTIDIGALTDKVVFSGNWSGPTQGLGTLSTDHVVAYYRTPEQMLFIDINHDAVINEHDISVSLTGVSTLGAWNIVA